MALLSKNAQAAVAGGGAYLNPGKIAAGSSVRFCLLSDEPLELYEAWAEGPDGKAKPFRFESEPSPDDLTLAFGDFKRRMGDRDPINYGIVGSEEYPIVYSVFRK